MAVTDLTNTTWVINDTTCDAGYGMFDVVTDSYGSSCRLGIGYTWCSRATGSYAEANKITSFDIGDFPIHSFNIEDSITFYGGSDVTNPSLISWLTANAIQQVEEDSDENSTTITFDLSSLGLPTGTYSIHVKLNGDGYRDSDASNIVEYTVGGSSASLISFTIDGTTYQAEDGTTWGEWINSEYNTDGYNKQSAGIILASNGWYVLRDGVLAYSIDIISNGAEYTISSPYD